MEKFVEKQEEDGVDRGEIRTVFQADESTIKSRGVTMCTKHTWVKKNENEVDCTACPTALIVNPDVIDSMLCQNH